MADYQQRTQHRLEVEFADFRTWIAERRGVEIPARWPEVEIRVNGDGDGGLVLTWEGPWEAVQDDG